MTEQGYCSVKISSENINLKTYSSVSAFLKQRERLHPRRALRVLVDLIAVHLFIYWSSHHLIEKQKQINIFYLPRSSALSFFTQ